MARDYKKPRTSKRSKDAQASPLRFLLGGFSMGVIAAAIVYYMMSPSAPRQPSEPTPVAERRPASEVDEDRDQPKAMPRPSTPAEPAPAEPDEDRFAFWEKLRDYEVIIPEADERVEKTRPQTPISKPGNYLIQIGAFRRFEDADRLKARLALQGIECYIERVMINDDQYHRVRIGPETQLDRVNALRDKLNEQDINVLVIRIPKP